MPRIDRDIKKRWLTFSLINFAIVVLLFGALLAGFAAYAFSAERGELEDSAEARLGKAQCESYLGDTATAMTELGELTTAYPEYANGWLALGSLYEQQGMTDEAAAAYQSAVDADADGSQGVKDSAQQYLDALQSADEETADDGSADAADESANAGTDADAAQTDSQETSE